jgi:2-C-methyl-D-erythritol 4-phosphate cytidylyltransferase
MPCGGSESRVRASFLLLAAGSGERLGLGPKGLLELRGRPLVAWLADKALQVADEVLVAVPPAQVALIAKSLPRCRVYAGGATRQDSLDLLAAQARGEWLLEHDGARPFATLALFRAVLDAAHGSGCAAALQDPQVLVARVHDGMLHAVHPREEIGLTQSPQAYSRATMERLRTLTRDRGWDASMTYVQRAVLAGIPVRAVAGECSNIKITAREDWDAVRHLEHLL